MIRRKEFSLRSTQSSNPSLKKRAASFDAAFCCRISISRKENPVQKWEYLRLDVTYNDRTIHSGIYNVVLNGKEMFSEEDSKSWDALQLYVNGLGEQGWELVSHAKSDYHEVLYFKRTK